MKVGRPAGTGGGVGRAGGQPGGTPAATAAGGAATVHGGDFATALSGVQLRDIVGDLPQVMRELDTAAARLVRDPSVANLREYKSLMRALLQRVTANLPKLKEYKLRRRRRTDKDAPPEEERVLQLIVQNIDHELEALTEEILNRDEQKMAQDLAARLDGIRGLILNLLS